MFGMAVTAQINTNSSREQTRRERSGCNSANRPSDTLTKGTRAIMSKQEMEAFHCERQKIEEGEELEYRD